MGSPLPGDQPTDDVAAHRGHGAPGPCQSPAQALPASQVLVGGAPLDSSAGRATSHVRQMESAAPHNRHVFQRPGRHTPPHARSQQRLAAAADSRERPHRESRGGHAAVPDPHGWRRLLPRNDGTTVQSGPPQSGRRLHMEMSTTTPSSPLSFRKSGLRRQTRESAPDPTTQGVRARRRPISASSSQPLVSVAVTVTVAGPADTAPTLPPEAAVVATITAEEVAS